MQKRRKQLELLCEICVDISQSIRYKNSTIPEILEYILDNDRYKLMRFSNSNSANDIAISFTNSDKCYLNKNEKDELVTYFSMLGSTDSEGQIQLCERYKLYFHQQLNHTDEDDRKKRKLYYSLGVFSGLFLVVILF